MEINKLFRRYALIGVAAFGAVACNNDNESSVQGESGLVNITGQVFSAQTRATAIAFEDNDSIGLYAMVWNDETPSVAVPLGTGEGYVNNIQMKWGNGGFNYMPDTEKLYWPSFKRNLDLYAYYPYNTAGLEVGSSLLPVAVLTDQSDAAKLTASDVMTACMLGVEKTSQVIMLPFKHALSKLKVSLVAGDGYQESDFTGAVIKLAGVMTSTKLDISKLPGQEGFVGAVENPSTITMFNGEAIIIPQTIAEGQVFIEVYDKEGNRMSEVKAVSGKNQFDSSNQYNVTITLKKKGATVTADITDWTVFESFITQDEYQSIEIDTDNGALTEGNISFDNNDQIGLFATKWESADTEGTVVSYLNNYQLTWANTTFTGDPIYWPTAKRKLNFYAYAPYQPQMVMTGTSIPVNVIEDQTVNGTTDWLISSALGVDRTSGKVIFTFGHVLSKIHVTLVYGDGYAGDQIDDVNVKLAHTFVTANVNMVDKKVTPVTTGATTKAIALKKADMVFTGALIPQTVAKDSKLLMIYDSENKLAASLTLSEDKIFESGKEYKLTITLKKKGIGFTADIAKWDSVAWGNEDANQDWN